MTVESLSGRWRPALELLVRNAGRDLTVACPFIKHAEAQWITNLLPSSANIHVLTNISAASVAEQTLDISALSAFHDTTRARLVSLPRLHAKVFIADNDVAIVTSGNLTTAGLDFNFEYGVRLEDRTIVRQVREDLERYASLGSAIEPLALPALRDIGDALIAQRRQLDASASSDELRAFARVLRKARQTFLAAQVGGRSANEQFSIAIRLVLESGPRTTSSLAVGVQALLPELCDDTQELVINGERFGKAWKHRLRNAQQYLKRRGELDYEVQRDCGRSAIEWSWSR